MITDSLPLVLSALLIFLMRIADVSLGTLRIGFLVRGKRRLAGLFGFFESLIWLFAAAQVLSNLDSVWKFIAYAAGYAVGTMMGVSIERWLAMGTSLMRVVSTIDTPETSVALREAGYYVTELNAKGRDGDVRVSFTVLPRRREQAALKLITTINPTAFVTFEATTATRPHAVPAATVKK
ncbi:MAG TPA: DUF5698 domain-containing protein [Trueperaceae bacterium]|nr:DUF5698 domain-containing protein [Trueperaceae bacterium]